MIRALACSLLLLALLSATARSQTKATDLLPGTWKANVQLDEEVATKMLVKQGIDEKKAVQFLPIIKAQIEKLSFTLVFDNDGNMSFSQADDKEPVKFKYEIVSSKNGKVVLKTTDAEGKTENHNLQFKGDNYDEFELELTDKLGPVPVKRPVFKRVKPRRESE